ncbi:MAG: disulfide bond formation protein B [Burkholderiales bacterium]|jgi:disulfide bond formation protein DsbB|nr:disulfide bond formation protein B [Burkholderiales bacterium]
MTDPRIAADRAGRLFTLVLLVTLGLVGFALYLQHGTGLDPCPLCVAQRVAFLAVGLAALVAALHRPRGAGITLYAVIAGLLAAGGAAIAVYHLWIQSDPKRASACVGSPVERIIDASNLAEWVPPLFRYDGPCTLKPWSLLGLSIPEWSLVWFVLLFLGIVLIPWLARR